MRRRLVIAALTAAALLAVIPAAASANYTISKSNAQSNTRDAARYTYSQYGIHRVVARCRPQSIGYDPHYTYHRWVCGWAGLDYEGDIASGRMRIDGHSDGTYGYTVLGGIHWR